MIAGIPTVRPLNRSLLLIYLNRDDDGDPARKDLEELLNQGGTLGFT